MKKRRWRRWLIALAALLLLAAVALDQRLIVRHYAIDAQEITSPVRLAVLSDLHACDYGENGAELLAAVQAQSPDVILMLGDMFADGGDYSYTTTLMQQLSAQWPCYYVTGNHEFWTNEEERIVGLVRECGVTVLDMESDTLTVNGQTLRLFGVPDPYVRRYREAPQTEGQLETVAADLTEDVFSILLAHRPELIEKYAVYPFDLVVSGHAHGGQVRIPGIINGLYAPSQGWFPPYAGGEYRVGGTTMIVSRGLSTQAQWYVPRIFNRPELVIIDLN